MLAKAPMPIPLPTALQSSLSSTDHIVQALTRSIIEHRLEPGEKLKEQRIADQFGVSRTLVRQALYQLSQKHLIRIEQSRGAFVCSPSAKEAREVFAVRMMLESAMIAALVDPSSHRDTADLECVPATIRSTPSRARLRIASAGLPKAT